MKTQTNKLIVPRYYQPWPHQARAWQRRLSGKYTFYFKLWARQLGKDTDDFQYDMRMAWDNPGTQSAYIGLDNVWIRANIFNKYIDGRRFWDEYPEEYIEHKDTVREVYFKNNPPGKAESLIKFIGFLNDEALIGSSYDRFTISEASLYKDKAFQYIRPIWDRKLARGLPLSVSFNGTPRGQHNVFYDLLRIYTGCDDPEEFPGEHCVNGVWCYVDKVTIQDALIPDGEGGFKPLYTEEEIENEKAKYMREFGNLNFYYQENEVNFTTVNAGLVYQGIEALRNEGRYHAFNLDTARPLYVAFDIASKGKATDATSAIIYQYYNGQMFIYDIYEERGKALVECISELSKRPYFHLIRLGILPWDSDRSASSETPIEEARNMFPNINWHALEKERVDRGIQQVRKQLPNMIINSDKCKWLMECFDNYEYGRLKKADDWTAKPLHTKHSHMMDALRYAVMGINEIKYFNMNEDGSTAYPDMEYVSFSNYEEYDDTSIPATYMKRKKKKNDGQSYQSFF